ncbi:TPA: hypothetical protein OZK16_002492 [Staphylococcus aureus]|uniref:hypothetical protein n=1 Tax=Staphylococcus aureus TaxID=1280 RepID=UPI000DE477D3|nr:hypothetical protein [Staphylococcus aureus]HCX3193305.1 hypothetical protein [Staphylococcus aureus]HDP5873761.1 hypothetical protein [Staphylococcus aureus]HDP5912834.1 hypothetical protein [Staphylococcus aureus]
MYNAFISQMKFFRSHEVLGFQNPLIQEENKYYLGEREIEGDSQLYVEFKLSNEELPENLELFILYYSADEENAYIEQLLSLNLWSNNLYQFPIPPNFKGNSLYAKVFLFENDESGAIIKSIDEYLKTHHADELLHILLSDNQPK